MILVVQTNTKDVFNTSSLFSNLIAVFHFSWGGGLYLLRTVVAGLLQAQDGCAQREAPGCDVLQQLPLLLAESRQQLSCRVKEKPAGAAGTQRLGSSNRKTRDVRNKRAAEESLADEELPSTCLRFLTAGPAEEGRCFCSQGGEKAAGWEFWENLRAWQPAERCLFLLPFLPRRRGLICWREAGDPALLGRAGEPGCRALTLDRGCFAGAALRGGSWTGRGAVSSAEEALLSSSSSSESEMWKVMVR